MSKLDNLPPEGEFLLYNTEDGTTRLEVRLVGDSLWLTQKQLAELFQKDVRTISEHIRNIFKEGELTENSVIRKFRITGAELQALSRKPMYMADWITKLDDFLRISDRELLQGTGAISHEQALIKAQLEYEKYRHARRNDPSLVEEHFNEAVKHVKKIAKEKPKPN